jgi:hypothetical protein
MDADRFDRLPKLSPDITLLRHLAPQGGVHA